MCRRRGSGIILILVVSMATLAFNTQLVRASVTIYIRADGSVEPATAPINKNGEIYTFTDNITFPIVVERNNTIVDSAGYVLQGTGSGTGITLSETNNVTTKNTNIESFNLGIKLHSSSNSNISGCIVKNNQDGIYLYRSSNNTITRNNIKHNNDAGLKLDESSENTLSRNNITINRYGIHLDSAQSNTLSGNIITDNQNGIYLYQSPDNILENNRMIYNDHNFRVAGQSLPDFVNDIDDSNTVDNQSIIYWVNRQNVAVPLDAGYLALVNCTYITVQNLNLSNKWHGILLAFTENSTISNNNITENEYGIWLQGSYTNYISGNNIENNKYGVCLKSPSENNTISSNKIINNEYGVYLFSSLNNSIWGNNLYHNDWGLSLEDNSRYNHVYANNITDQAWSGVYLFGSRDNTISRNTITDNSWGIFAQDSTYNVISENNLTRCYRAIYFINSARNSILKNNITNNNEGISIQPGSANTISRNYIAENNLGIYIGYKTYSSSNIISGNTIENNKKSLSIGFWYNKVYHNNFINNTDQPVSAGDNIWDDGYPSGGNYFSDYIGTNNDGLGYPPKIIDQDDQDTYPLMGLFSSFDTGISTYTVDMISNSTVLDFYFNPEEGAFIRFTVTGQDDTIGFCRVTIPNQLVWCDNPEQWEIRVNNTLIEHRQVIEDNGYTYIYFTYNQSTQNVEIKGSHAIPEFPTWIMLLILTVLSFIVVIFKRKRANFYKVLE